MRKIGFDTVVAEVRTILQSLTCDPRPWGEVAEAIPTIVAQVNYEGPWQ
jgi:hypothetical protein